MLLPENENVTIPPEDTLDGEAANESKAGLIVDAAALTVTLFVTEPLEPVQVIVKV